MQTLKHGDTGDGVKAAQRILKRVTWWNAWNKLDPLGKRPSRLGVFLHAPRGLCRFSRERIRHSTPRLSRRMGASSRSSGCDHPSDRDLEPSGDALSGLRMLRSPVVNRRGRGTLRRYISPEDPFENAPKHVDN